MATPDATPLTGDPHPKRLASLDAFRGLTIAAMILVNNPGSWNHTYGPLRHAEWHGCTPTDLIFPFFLLIVGAAAAFSIPKALGREPNRIKLLLRVVRRCVVLFALGLMLNGFPFYDFGEIRIPGVLQRIALVYLLLVPLVLFLPRTGQAVVAFGLALAHWWLLVAFGGDDPFGPERNLASRIDEAIIGRAHLYHEPTDPEGLLGTLSAVLTAWIGYAVGQRIRRHGPTAANSGKLAAAGLGLIALGWLWSLAFPLNKPLWTGSYAVFTAGWALVFLAALLAIIDGPVASRRTTKAFQPAVTFGLNAIFVFVASGLIARLLVWVPAAWASDGVNTPTIKGWAFDTLVSAGLEPINASLAYAILNVVLWWPVLAFMRRRNWLFKV